MCTEHTGKRLDLLPHNVDATVIRRVQLKHHLAHVSLPINLPREREDGRRLARAGGAVEQEMREALHHRLS